MLWYSQGHPSILFKLLWTTTTALQVLLVLARVHIITIVVCSNRIPLRLSGCSSLCLKPKDSTSIVFASTAQVIQACGTSSKCYHGIEMLLDELQFTVCTQYIYETS